MKLLILAFSISFCLTSDELKTESKWLGKKLSPVYAFNKVQSSWTEVNVQYTIHIRKSYYIRCREEYNRTENEKEQTLWSLHQHQLTYCIITIIAILFFSFLAKKKKDKQI